MSGLLVHVRWASVQGRRYPGLALLPLDQRRVHHGEERVAPEWFRAARHRPYGAPAVGYGWIDRCESTTRGSPRASCGAAVRCVAAVSVDDDVNVENDHRGIHQVERGSAVVEVEAVLEPALRNVDSLVGAYLEEQRRRAKASLRASSMTARTGLLGPAAIRFAFASGHAHHVVTPAARPGRKAALPPELARPALRARRRDRAMVQRQVLGSVRRYSIKPPWPMCSRLRAVARTGWENTVRVRVHSPVYIVSEREGQRDRASTQGSPGFEGSEHSLRAFPLRTGDNRLLRYPRAPAYRTGFLALARAAMAPRPPARSPRSDPTALRSLPSRLTLL